LFSGGAAAAAAPGATRVYGALLDLEVAVKGGRVSAPAARLAGIIDLKPLIIFDEEGGTHVDGARLGYHWALRAVAERVARFASGSAARLAIVHADGLESAQFVRERLASLVGDGEIPIMQAGAVITTHVGLGTVAVGVRRLQPPSAADQGRRSLS